ATQQRRDRGRWSCSSTQLARTSSCRGSSSSRTSLELQGLPHDGRALVAEPGRGGALPLVGQRPERGKRVVAGGVEREPHVLEREPQRELWGEVALDDALELGRLPRRNERSRLERVHHRLGVETQPVG